MIYNEDSNLVSVLHIAVKVWKKQQWKLIGEPKMKKLISQFYNEEAKVEEDLEDRNIEKSMKPSFQKIVREKIMDQLD